MSNCAAVKLFTMNDLHQTLILIERLLEFLVIDFPQESQSLMKGAKENKASLVDAFLVAKKGLILNESKQVIRICVTDTLYNIVNSFTHGGNLLGIVTRSHSFSSDGVT